MANQNFDLTGTLQVRAAAENDAEHLHTYCLADKTKKQVTDELKADLGDDSQTHRLVAEASGYAIGQIKVEKNPGDAEIGQIADLAVSGPFRQLGVADHLIKAAESTALENGMKTLEIEVAPTDGPVIQRYKDWGFAEKPIVILQKALSEEAEETEAEEADAEEAADAPADGEQQKLLDR